VGDEEALARLLHSRIVEPEGQPFMRGELFPKPSFSNECGQSSGASLVRRDALSDGEIRDRATAHAQRKAGRTQQGCIQAKAGDLRAIQDPEIAQGRLVYVYDDPSDEEALHAVLRCVDIADRPSQSALRDLVADAFASGVSP
jgi:hypothetical protein